MYIFVILLGYALGMLSPSALIAKAKNINLKASGSGNLGATNTTMVLGKKYGIIVMLLDVGKSYLAVKLARYLFPALRFAGLVAGFSAIVGHIYPFYLNFRGGKGLAAYGGMVLAIDPLMFPILLVLGLVLMLITNEGVAMPLMACTLFPILHGFHSGSIVSFLILAVLGFIVAFNHKSNIQDTKENKQVKTRDFIKTYLFPTDKQENP